MNDPVGGPDDAEPEGDGGRGFTPYEDLPDVKASTGSPVKDELRRMGIREFEAVLSDKDDPRHEAAEEYWREIMAPLQSMMQGIVGSSAVAAAREMSESLSKALPTSAIDYGKLTGAWSKNFGQELPNWQLGTSIPQTRLVAGDKKVTTIKPAPIVPDPTVAQVAVAVDAVARDLQRDQVDRLDRLVEFAESEAADRAAEVEPRKGDRKTAKAGMVLAAIAAGGTIATLLIAVLAWLFPNT